MRRIVTAREQYEMLAPWRTAVQIKDIVPSDFDWLEPGSVFQHPENVPTDPVDYTQHNNEPSGSWFHVSPRPLEPGTRLTPGGASGLHDTSGDWGEESSLRNRRNHVWIAPNYTKAKFWHSQSSPDARIYEVKPGDKPQRWNYTGSEGWVVPHAHVIRDVTPNRQERRSPLDWQNSVDETYATGIPGRYTATAHPNSHPDLHESFRVHGTVHTTGGRVLPIRTAVADRATQESRLADPTGWSRHVAFQPVASAVQGARAYNSKIGLPDPHQMDYSKIRQNPDTIRTVGRHYDSLPDYDPKAAPHYAAMANEVGHQYDHLTNTMGINVQSMDHDPYSDVHEMIADVNNNKRLKVLGTHVTGGHPAFSDADNDKFRAVHDFFGHAATGRSFDRHGEQAAYLAHSQMFSPQARPAMAAETKGQNSSLILNGHFGPQKTAIMDPQHYWHDLSSITTPRAARKKATMDSVTLYTKPECPQCRMTKQRLEFHGIPHETIDLTQDPAAYSHVTSNLGYVSAPVVDAGGGNHWSGFRPDRIKALVD